MPMRRITRAVELRLGPSSATIRASSRSPGAERRVVAARSGASDPRRRALALLLGGLGPEVAVRHPHR